jgi:hypothetical protein
LAFYPKLMCHPERRRADLHAGAEGPLHLQ